MHEIVNAKYTNQILIEIGFIEWVQSIIFVTLFALVYFVMRCKYKYSFASVTYNPEIFVYVTCQ